MNNSLIAAIDWSNQNQGALAVLLFLAALVVGWTTGIFSALRKKPKLRIRMIEGPSFVCVFGTGETHNGFDVHRTGVAIYLSVANIGSAATSIEHISIGYRWSIAPFKRLWWRYGVLRFWLREQTVALSDFQVAIGENLKIYPFMTQKSSISGDSAHSFLEVGQSTNGVVYFEQEDSWGACFPHAHSKMTSIKVEISDVFGRKYRSKLMLPRVNLSQARDYNPNFGLTRSKMNNSADPIDLPTDAQGNLIAPAN